MQQTEARGGIWSIMQDAGGADQGRQCGGCGEEAGRAEVGPAVHNNAFVLSSEDRRPRRLRWSLWLSAALNEGVCMLCSP